MPQRLHGRDQHVVVGRTLQPGHEPRTEDDLLRTVATPHGDVLQVDGPGCLVHLVDLVQSRITAQGTRDGDRQLLDATGLRVVERCHQTVGATPTLIVTNLAARPLDSGLDVLLVDIGKADVHAARLTLDGEQPRRQDTDVARCLPVVDRLVLLGPRQACFKSRLARFGVDLLLLVVVERVSHVIRHSKPPFLH